MRRIFSISVIVALMGSLASPVWATPSCEHTVKAPVCHRNVSVQHHHCHEMEPEQAEISVETGPATEIANGAPQCPMNCCIQAHQGQQGAVPALSVFPPQAASAESLHQTIVVFSSTGFSSHTDRGPPAA